MGKATIVSHLGDGEYSVWIHYEVEELLKKIKKLNTQISELNTAILFQKAKILDFKNDLDDALFDMNAAIDIYAADPTNETKRAAVTKATREGIKAAHLYDIEKDKLDQLVSEKLSATKRAGWYESHNEEFELKSIWCADLLDNQDGRPVIPADAIVGTIDVLRDARIDSIIKPAWTAGAPATWLNALWEEADGMLQDVVANTPAAAFVNTAMLPGSQRWEPIYRTAIIDGWGLGGKHKVNFIADKTKTASQSEEILVTPTESAYCLIDYMNCDFRVFEDTNEVLVEFKTRDFEEEENPTIIGFVHDPQYCDGTHGKYPGNGAWLFNLELTCANGDLHCFIQYDLDNQEWLTWSGYPPVPSEFVAWFQCYYNEVVDEMVVGFGANWFTGDICYRGERRSPPVGTNNSNPAIRNDGLILTAQSAYVGGKYVLYVHKWVSGSWVLIPIDGQDYYELKETREPGILWIGTNCSELFVDWDSVSSSGPWSYFSVTDTAVTLTGYYTENPPGISIDPRLMPSYLDPWGFGWVSDGQGGMVLSDGTTIESLFPDYWEDVAQGAQVSVLYRGAASTGSMAGWPS